MDWKTRHLAWMELRERRTQWVCCVVWMLGGTACCIASAFLPGAEWLLFSFFVTTLAYAIVAPIFLAMRTALGELTDRTRSFSDGLPISVRRRGWIRLAGGVGVLVVPIAAGATLLSAYLAIDSFTQATYRWPRAVALTWDIAAVTAWSATSLYLIVCLMGTALRAESHLGYCGVAVTCLWLAGALCASIPKSLGHPEIGLWIGAIAPHGIVFSYCLGDRTVDLGDLGAASVCRAALGPLLVNTALQFGLARWFVRRYSRTALGAATEPAAKITRGVWWRPPLPARGWPTRGLALAWLAWRQSVPMCLSGLVIACLIATPEFFSTRALSLDARQPLWRLYTDALPSGMSVIGILWAAVVGAGIFSAEIDWRIGEFWRTRPIAAWRLFGVKFVAGLLAVLLVLDGSVIAATWRSPNWGAVNSMNWPYIACMLPLHATMFAIAVAWTCVLRRAVLGATAALATFVLLEIALYLSATTRGLSLFRRFFQLYSADGTVEVVSQGYPLAAAAMGLVLVASTLIGWRALRRYDPRRQTG